MTRALSRLTPLHDALHDFLPTETQFRSSGSVSSRENRGYVLLHNSGAEPRMFFSGCILNPNTEMTDFSREQL
jgi:hypothetical protein